MKDRALQIRDAARRFLVFHGANVREREIDALLEQCGQHLVQEMKVQESEAYDIALSCWSEIEGAKSRCFIDLELSTPYLVFVVDPVAGTRHPFPVVDLIKMLGPRLAA
jgi:hypothetical protein